MIKQPITKSPVISPHRQRTRENAMKQITGGLSTLHAEYRVDKITDVDTIQTLESIIKSVLQLKTRIKK